MLLLDLDFINGMMGAHMKGTFKKITCTAKAYINGQMVDTTKAHSKTIRMMDTENISTLTAGAIGDSGKMGYNMEMEFSQIQKAIHGQANGRTASESVGQMARIAPQ